MSSTFKTDVAVRGSLNAGLLPPTGRGQSTAGAGASGRVPEVEITSDEFLDRFEEELHKKVDNDIEVLVDGLEECVALSKVGTKDKFKAAQDALEVELKAESMVRATESLLSLSHTLKLLFLLDNEDEGSAKVQEAQQEEAQKELQAVKDQAKRVLSEVLARQ